MTKHFHRDLENLHGQVLAMSSLVEEMIDHAGRALCAANFDSGSEVVVADREVDRREVQIEEECLKMLALHQPVAIDLRRIATVLKINSDLERIGDLTLNIVQRASCLQQRPDFPIPARIEEMVGMAGRMVRAALDAFVNADPDAANEVCAQDDRMDHLNRDVIAELIEQMQQRPDSIIPGMHCFSAARHLERIADHATNIAEDVVYLVTGEIIRHGLENANATDKDLRSCPEF